MRLLTLGATCALASIFDEQVTAMQHLDGDNEMLASSGEAILPYIIAHHGLRGRVPHPRGSTSTPLPWACGTTTPMTSSPSTRTPGAAQQGQPWPPLASYDTKEAPKLGSAAPLPARNSTLARVFPCLVSVTCIFYLRIRNSSSPILQGRTLP